MQVLAVSVSLLRLRWAHGRIFRPASLFGRQALGESELLFLGKLGSWETIWTSQPVQALGKSELLSMGEEDSRSY